MVADLKYIKRVQGTDIPGALVITSALQLYYTPTGALVLYQDNENNIFQSSFGVHENVTHIFLSSNEIPDSMNAKQFRDFIFDSQLPKYKQLHKKYVEVMNPKKFEEQKMAMKYYDQVRDKTAKRKERDHVRDKTPKRQARDQEPARKEMHRVHDQVRDKTPKRKERDHVRDKTPKRQARDQEPARKDMHRVHDQVRDQEPARIKKHRETVRKAYLKKLINRFYTDTGFDLICSSCLQYKSTDYCKSINVLSHKEQKKYLISKCSIMKHREEGQFICNLCLTDIRKGKVPKRSHKSSFRFANFPKYLIEKLKSICTFKQNEFSSGLTLDQENHERTQTKLNKLEAYLLKLCIPFIRIAHCPRGTYLRVLGDLILISSDLSHSPLNKT